jgi:hypothetical protein
MKKIPYKKQSPHDPEALKEFNKAYAAQSRIDTKEKHRVLKRLNK